MIDLHQRSYKPELLDQEDIPFEDIRLNMQELNRINSLLGGHAITIKGLQKIIDQQQIKGSIIICEIGCGGGDNLLALDGWCRKQNITVQFIGIDIKPACIVFAKKQCAHLTATWLTSNYELVQWPHKKPDIIFSSLFCHHFPESELIGMLQWMQQHSSKGFFINDLQRHPLAYYSIKIITGIFSKSYLVKNDAPLSVARGFKKSEWQHLFATAGINAYSIEWKWAFRYLICYTHD